MGIVSRSIEPISIWHHRADYGYPVPGIHRDRTLAQILPMLAKQRIHSLGRFGAWKYEVGNQDHAFMQGVEIVNRILDKEL